jgi:hypothetical protein
VAATAHLSCATFATPLCTFSERLAEHARRYCAFMCGYNARCKVSGPRAHLLTGFTAACRGCFTTSRATETCRLTALWIFRLHLITFRLLVACSACSSHANVLAKHSVHPWSALTHLIQDTSRLGLRFAFEANLSSHILHEAPPESRLTISRLGILGPARNKRCIPVGRVLATAHT